MHHLNILEYKRYRYLKAAFLLAVVSILAYVLHRPAIGPNGGTWLGYTLGVIGTLIIFWLLWFGIRKRRYRGVGSLHGWLSAHVYLGGALIIVVTLHTGFQFGWNVHTLAYVLMMAVIISGFYGIYTYLRFPRLMTENIGEDSLEVLLLKIAELDELARHNALQLSDEINEIVLKSSRETRIGGSALQQLSANQQDCPTSAAVMKLRDLDKNLEGDQPKHHRELYLIMLRKEALVARARRDVMYKAQLEFWLYFHVPLSIGLIAALVAHITSIAFYW